MDSIVCALLSIFIKYSCSILLIKGIVIPIYYPITEKIIFPVNVLQHYKIQCHYSYRQVKLFSFSKTY